MRHLCKMLILLHRQNRGGSIDSVFISQFPFVAGKG